MGKSPLIVVLATLLLCGCSSTKPILLTELPLYGDQANNHTFYTGSDDRFHYFEVTRGGRSAIQRVWVSNAKVAPRNTPHDSADAQFVFWKDKDTVFVTRKAWLPPEDAEDFSRGREGESHTTRIIYDKVGAGHIREITRDEAYQCLLQASSLYGARYGFNNEPPATVYAVGRLLHEKDAEQIFIDLAMESRSAGKLYGLMGLYLCNSEMTRAFAYELERCDAKVWRQYGCIASTFSIGYLARTSLLGEGLPDEYFVEFGRSAYEAYEASER